MVYCDLLLTLDGVLLGNKGLIKLLPMLSDAGIDRMLENADSTVNLLTGDLTGEEKTTLLEVLSKMCCKKPKVIK